MNVGILRGIDEGRFIRASDRAKKKKRGVYFNNTWALPGQIERVPPRLMRGWEGKGRNDYRFDPVPLARDLFFVELYFPLYYSYIDYRVKIRPSSKNSAARARTRTVPLPVVQIENSLFMKIREKSRGSGVEGRRKGEYSLKERMLSTRRY